MSDRRQDPSWLTLALVGVGGAAGVVARASLMPVGDGFLVITVINVVGSLLLGILVGAVSGLRIQRVALPLLGTGFLGGFTTLSAVSAALISTPGPLTFALVGLQVVLGTGAAWVGLELAERLRGGRR